MKKFTIALLASALLILFVPACKKEKELTTAQKIQNKWSIQSISYNDHYNGTDHPMTITGMTGDYADFRSDLKLYIDENGVKDTMNYQILSDSKIALDGDAFDIKALTESSFIIYRKEMYTTTDFEESTMSFKR